MKCLCTPSVHLWMYYTISDAVHVEECCECTPVNSEQSLISENSMGSMNENLPSTFCLNFTFDSIRAEQVQKYRKLVQKLRTILSALRH